MSILEGNLKSKFEKRGQQAIGMSFGMIFAIFLQFRLKPRVTPLFYSKLDSKNVRHVNFAEWSQIDAKEIEHGEPKGKPREKFTYVEEMLSVVKQ